jgi:hypothetical protein
MPIPSQPWGRWVGTAGALVAACVLAALAWQGHDGKAPVTPSRPAHPVASSVPDGPAGIGAWREARRNLNEAEAPAFTWPLGETPPVTVSTAIPADLLD